jgi:hypothetical protein
LRFSLRESEGLRLGDVTAVASLVVVELLLDSVVLAVFVPVDSYFGTDVAGVISILSDARILVCYLKNNAHSGSG